ncbi:hypothetical protein UNDYM_4109 [Undibacterium sp. YM2]|uniref:CPCC family cysteine-rich protein n=1 Tax=Undibacterium sp. YM2 TaxID=2058625 RepID=UPI001331D308|nr:CPCC family cysteine-rich protein [Undibacterium sp. YM2]BBB68362.1 hypothetical protein UNDYM_4109 [Undibacterium sp. YM2]
MTRDEAIDLLVLRDLARLSTKEREALLLDWWSIDAGDSGYAELTDLLKEKITCCDEPDDPDNAIYDFLLKIALRHTYLGVVNSYLEAQTALHGSKVVIEGRVEKLMACPCCGYRSLDVNGEYEICRVCFWEDDGTCELDQLSSPNRMTLREAQQNFQDIGAVSEEVQRYVLSDGRERYVFERQECET